MIRPSWRAAILFLAAASLAVLASYRSVLPPPDTPQEPEVWTLDLEQEATDPVTLAGGQTHHYSLSLEQGQFVDLLVEQQGIDLVLELYTPAGELETTVDSPNKDRGPEPLPVLGDVSGEYRLAVIAGGDAPPGRYLVRLLAVRPAEPRDRARVTAERTFAQGEGFRRADTPDSTAKALDAHLRALERFRVLGDRDRVADVLFASGRVHELRDEPLAAIVAYEQALALFRQASRSTHEAMTLNNLGLSLVAVRRTEESLPYLDEAFRIHSLNGDTDRYLTLINLGVAYGRLGEVDRATEALRAASEGLREVGDESNSAIALYLLGRLYFQYGQIESAVYFGEQAADALRKSSRRRDYARALVALGNAYFFSGRSDESKGLFREALDILGGIAGNRNRAIAHNDLGVVLNELGDLERAEAHYQEASQLFSHLGDDASLGTVLANLGRLQLELERPGAAETTLRAALSRLEGLDQPIDEANALYGLAQLQSYQGELRTAAATLERSLQRIEVFRGGSRSADLRSATLELEHPQFALYIDVLMRLHALEPIGGWAAKAFETAERSRARGLLDDLTAPPALLRARTSDSLLEEEASLGQEISAAAEARQVLLTRPSSESELAAVARSLRYRFGAMDHVEARIRHAADGEEGHLEPSHPSLEQLQNEALDEDTALMEFALGDRRSFLWVLTQDSLRSFELPARSEIEQRSAALHRALALGDQPLARGYVEKLLQELSDMLLGPAPYVYRYKRIVIVPDGDLAYVPFSALPTPSAEGRDLLAPGSPGQPLGTAHEVVVEPSASALLLLRRRGLDRGPADSLLTVGDAVYDSSDPRLSNLSLSTTPHGSSSSLRRLRWAEAELEAIRMLAMDRRLVALSGLDATKATLLAADFSQFGIIHLAIHGLFDPEFPHLSAIALSRFDHAGSAQDNLVRAFELRRLDLRADLVVVSACQTARGRHVRGEGVVGLASSLISAGARQVLVSLWEVDDEATFRLMEELYRGILERQVSPVAALRQAQAKVSSQAKWRSPYYWAGFVLIGDWQAGLRRTKPTSAGSHLGSASNPISDHQ